MRRRLASISPPPDVLRFVLAVRVGAPGFAPPLDWLFAKAAAARARSAGLVGDSSARIRALADAPACAAGSGSRTTVAGAADWAAPEGERDRWLGGVV